ncbi:hypothetical protein [Synechococcus sp. CCY 9618]|uniref:hypothetical protein n=1 Tax=Synechococcus sp. CCY 9618 TaxID=2815602 RepID=UPI001C24D1EF|nr:hypothetical protein [Synechococcus sp. CCY 9618]
MHQRFLVRHPYLKSNDQRGFKHWIPVISLSLLMAPSTAARADTKFVNAHFYAFTPTACRMALDQYGASSCDAGAVSVAADNPDSVNLHMHGKLGQWQLLIKEATSTRPRVDLVVIRSSESIAKNQAKPDYFFTRSKGEITKGNCSPIPLKKESRGRCTVRLKDGRSLEMSFSTHNLSPANKALEESPAVARILGPRHPAF